MTPDTIEALIAADPVPAGLILHVGPGLLAPFADGPPEGARLVLVEADPDRAAALGRRHAGQPRVSVRAAAAAPKAGPAVLQRLSPGDFSSLRKPKALARIYPGLGAPEEVPVEGIAIADLVAEALTDPAPDPQAAIWLILEAPGLETALFAALAAAPAAERVGRLLVRAARETLYESTPFDPATLGPAGFELVDACRDADPDWLWYLARRRTPEPEAPAEAPPDPEEIAALRRDLRVALRNQALAEADLRDLRARYATVLDERTAQEALIGKLAQRLGEASDWLRRIGPADEVTGALAEPGAPEALPREDRKPRKGRRKGKA